MTRLLPAMDAHAHVQTSVPARDLRALNAIVFAVTREPAEWTAASRRSDALAIWGIGVHPGNKTAIEAFDAARFARDVEQFVLVGEVGLDGRSPVPMADQQRVFEAVLEIVADLPRPVSIHSVSASAEVLEALKRRPIRVPILHWWRGGKRETREAVEMGCYFSFNGAEAMRPKVLDLVPSDRVLTETDFPFTRRADRAAIHPGATPTIETALATIWRATTDEVRLQVWRNFERLMVDTGLVSRLSAEIRREFVGLGDADDVNRRPIHFDPQQQQSLLPADQVAPPAIRRDASS